MTESDRKKAAKAFAEYWKDRGDEKSDSQSFGLPSFVMFSVLQNPKSLYCLRNV